MTAPLHKRSLQRGFTLLEIIVVVVIIGVLASLMTFSLGGNSRVNALEDEARRLTALVELAAQESVLQSQELMLEVSATGYGFAAYNGEVWQPLAGDDILRAREMPDDIRLSAVVDGVDLSGDAEAEEGGQGVDVARVFILSSGEMSTFEITLRLFGGPAFRLDGGPTGALDLQGPSDTL